MSDPVDHRRPRVVVAGGGVGAIEAALALRALAGEMVTVTLVSPEDEFVHRPLAVAEPFGYAAPHRVPLARLEHSHNIRHEHDAIIGIDAGRRAARLQSGGELSYDVLLVAVGARPRTWLPEALTFGGPKDAGAYRELLDAIESGDVGQVLFAVPPGATWTLPVYELALLTAAWLVDKGVIGERLTIATPEQDPLGIFGPAASRAVRDLLGDRGIELFANAAVASVDGQCARLEDGRRVDADRVVTLPQLTGNPIAGLPTDEAGFIPIDEHAAVKGVAHVYAVGDATSYPIKQGGLAAQQADAAAAAIAAELGANIEPTPFVPVMRGLLLTGVTSAYLRAGEHGDGQSEAAFHPLWWPPNKIAGRYLAPYLAQQPNIGPPGQLEDRPAAPGDARERDELRDMALDFARMDADLGDFRSALRWLQTVEELEGALRPEHAALREQWERGATG